MINIRELIDDFKAEGYTDDLAIQMAKEELAHRVSNGKKSEAQYNDRIPRFLQYRSNGTKEFVGDGSLPMHLNRPKLVTKVGKERLVRVRKRMS